MHQKWLLKSCRNQNYEALDSQDILIDIVYMSASKSRQNH